MTASTAMPPTLGVAATEAPNIDLVQYVAATSLMLLAFFGFTEFAASTAVQIAVLLVLLRPELLKNPWLWTALGVVHVFVLFDGWMVSDNHKYLTVYLIFTNAIATSFDDPRYADRYLAGTARFFLVFIFGVAALQKLLSSTYMSGEMFELRLLTDDRFGAFAHLLGVDKQTLFQAKNLMLQLRSPFVESEGGAVRLPGSEWTNRIASMVTWYDVLVQFAIAALFLVRRRATDLAGHALLLFFIWTTYIPAPVFGFGWLLCILGLAVSAIPFPKLRPAYLASFIAVLAYQMPWRDWVMAW